MKVPSSRCERAPEVSSWQLTVRGDEFLRAH